MGYDIKTIKDRTAIEDLFAQDGAALRPMGRRFVCLSPFQREKTPSCYVDPDRQTFKCWSTGNSGDALDYVMLVHNVDLKRAIELLAARAGIGPDTDWRALPKPKPRPVVEAKAVEPLAGAALARWQEACRYLSDTPGETARLAHWRGFDPATIDDLSEGGKIGLLELDADLRRQDWQPGSRRVAFPVEAPPAALGLPGDPDAGLLPVSVHVRLKPRAGESRAGWRFCPSGVGAWPYVLGNVATARFLIICEGQWDAIAFYDVLIGRTAYSIPGLEALEQEGIAIVGMRGAHNWKLFLEHFLFAGFSPERLAQIVTSPHELARPDLRVLVVCDLDLAGATWTTPNDDEPCLVEILQATCQQVFVREPEEELGCKDVNDILKSLPPMTRRAA